MANRSQEEEEKDDEDTMDEDLPEDLQRIQGGASEVMTEENEEQEGGEHV